MINIKDSGDPRVAPYSSLKGKMLERDGVFIAEGEKVVESMVDSGCRVASCLVAAGAIDRYEAIVSKASGKGAAIYIASDELIEDIIGFRFHRGIMALGHCPEKKSVTGALKRLKRPLLLIALDSVNDPQNVGLIARNASAFGAGALLVDGATYDPYYRKAVRVSMGAIFRLPVFYEDDLESSLVRLKKDHGVRVIAATPGRSGTDIRRVRFSGDICIVFGNEDNGVSRRILDIADTKVRIPISKGVDSLNVASASAVFLHLASRNYR